MAGCAEVSSCSVFAEESSCLQFFGSGFWKYPVYVFAGLIIKGEHVFRHR